MPTVIGAGTVAASADPVVTPTNLAPGLPGTRTAGDWLFCPTASTSATATVATPAGWQSIYNTTGTNGRLALFSKKSVGGSDTAPTVTWSSLTTGLSGTPCIARIVNMGTGFNESGGLLVVDAQGTVSNGAASTATMSGGVGVVTTKSDSIVFAQGIRGDDTLTNLADVGTGLTWAGVLIQTTTSGADMAMGWSWGIMTPAGAVGDHSWTLTGATVSVASSGVLVALEPTPPPTDTVPTTQAIYTRSRVRLRRSF